MDVVLSIAGSDSCAGAGIQADIKAIAACGGYAVTAITAITAQNTQGVQAASAVGADMLRRQLESLFADVPIASAKTGMLANAEQVRLVVDFLRSHPVPFLVVDPVMVATSGDLLLEADAIAVVREDLLPLATVATPNHAELAALTGRTPGAPFDVQQAAQELLERGCAAIVVTGGDAPQHQAEDLLVQPQRTRSYRAPRIDTPHTHGTGCTFSAALATRLAQGQTLVEAVLAAKVYVNQALRTALALGKGRGPADHLFALREFGDTSTASHTGVVSVGEVR
jgi:hydroxymethylpyrimidine/phosphomethylpyrimidine kinase